MTENNKLQELAEIELERAKKKINYAEKMLAEVKELTALIEELLKHEKAL
jgi:hypothetical protein